jgi:signal transduction histidine kinase
MNPFRLSGLYRYAVPIATVAVAVLLSWPLRPLQDISMPLLVLAVLVSAWYGGFGPALAAAVLALLTSDFLFIEPIYSIDLNLSFLERSVAFGLVLGVTIWFANIRKAAERKLREQSERLQQQTRALEAIQEELRRADRMKDDFLAVLSHELRNPLGAIRNGLYLLRDGRTENPGHVHEMMDRQLKQLVRLIEDLLDVSRITRGTIVLRKEPVELSQVVRDAVELSRAPIEAQGHELAVSLPPQPVTLLGDRSRLAQVFSNVLHNAAKFTPARGRIDLDARQEDGAIVVRIRDNGTGIPVDMLDQVFGMFTQADRSPARRSGGLGIGLSLVRGLVEAHGGTVVAHSEGVGKGSEIEVRLPAQDLPAPVHAG